MKRSKLNEKLLKEWNYEKNIGLNPNDFSMGSSKKVWWICDKGHEWIAEIKNRGRIIKPRNCPYCARQKVLKGFNDLESDYPVIAKQWDYKRNENIKPSDVISKTEKKFWWICDNGHEYKARVSSRVQGRGCPICNSVQKYDSLDITNKEILKYWDYEKNIIKPSDVSKGSNKKIWWVCDNGHSFKSVVESFVEKKGCPICNKWKRSSFPEQAIYYYTKKCFKDTINGYRDIFPRTMELDVYIPSLKIGIEYDGIVFHSKNNETDREKRKYDICKTNNIKLIRVKETDSLSNFNPYQDYKVIVKDSTYKTLNKAIEEVMMILENKIIVDVENDRNEILSLLNVRKESLATLYPNIVKEWAYEKNKPLIPQNVSPLSNKKVWWKCSVCGNEYERIIANQIKYKNINCPKCRKKAKDVPKSVPKK